MVLSQRRWVLQGHKWSWSKCPITIIIVHSGQDSPVTDVTLVRIPMLWYRTSERVAGPGGRYDLDGLEICESRRSTCDRFPNCAT